MEDKKKVVKKATSSKVPKIFGAMAGVLEEVKTIGKGGTNKFDKYNFRSIDDVFDALNPVMAKYGVFCTPVVLDRVETVVPTAKGGKQFHVVLTIKYIFYAMDGSNVECVVVGEAMDRSDKATNKAMQQALKYMILQTFMVPMKGSLDADSESPTMGEKKEIKNYAPTFDKSEDLPF